MTPTPSRTAARRSILAASPLLAILLLVISIMLAKPAVARAADWPAYRHDLARSAVTDEPIDFPLHEAWSYRCAQAPRPAWPETYSHLNRLDFDYAPHPVTGGGLVYFGSTADDAVRALDEKTGEPRWTFVTGGPVRFAPQFVAGKLYLGSDDGIVYCLDAATGKLLWQVRPAPYDDMLIGNGRMISRWPIRTGVLVMDNTVYAAAGMWNADGIHLVALNAETGAVVWRNDNAGYMSVFFKGMQAANPTAPVTELMKNITHEGEFGSTGINPQGALLAYEDQLIVPNGTSFAWRFSRANGLLKPWDNRVAPAPGVGGAAGGTWNCIDGGVMYTLAKYRTDAPSTTFINLSGPGPGRGIRVDVPNFNLQPPGVGSKYRPDDYIHDKGKASIIVTGRKGYARAAYAMALAGKTLLLGLDGAVVAQDADTERELWRAPVDGVAREIAVANGRVVVSTESGFLHSFETGKATAPPRKHDLATPVPGAAGPLPDAATIKLIDRLRAGGMDCGYALVLGDADGRVSSAVASATLLQVINAQTDPAAVAALRDRLISSSLYGTRLQVLPLTHVDQLPFTRYFANAVIVAGPVAVGGKPLSGRELYRVLRPYGGLLLTPGLSAAEAEALLKDSGATKEELAGAASGSAEKPSAIPGLRRGEILGARDWDSRTADRSAGGPMRVLWFGGPETQETQSFRQSTNPPVVVSGRYLNLAESRLTAVDAYNGTVQWSRIIPRQNRDLRGIDGLVYKVRETGTGAADAPDSGGGGEGDAPAAAPDVASEKGKGKAKGEGAHIVNDADMVSMDESAETGGGRLVRVSSDHAAFLIIGKAPNERWVELDLQTGNQKKLLTQWLPAPTVSLQKPQSWTLRLDAKHSGTIALASDAQGINLTLTTQDPVASNLDGWDLHFDLRPLAKRAGLYERGAFHFLVTPAIKPGGSPAILFVNGPTHPAVDLTGERNAAGTSTTLRLAWAELEKVAGFRPESFGFAATLNSHDGGKAEPIVRRHLFGDWTSEALNLGWANVFVGPAPATVEPPAIVAPLPAELWKQFPDPVGLSKKAPPQLDDAAANGLRVHPLTGELEPKIFRSGTGGCGGPHYTATERFGRATGNLGLYDFVDDSGLRNLCGIKAGCSTAITPALGLVIVSPEGGHCVCTFPFATTVTLAPSDRRLNEDWAIYHDRPADGLVRQAAINLGAFGDRRDDHGTLWLGFPRSPERAMNFSMSPGVKSVATTPPGLWMRYMPAAMQVPLTIEYLDPLNSANPADDLFAYSGMWAAWTPNRLNKPFGPYRVNSDVVPIANTDRPWIYGSGVRGLKKATLQLDFRRTLVASTLPVGAAKPTIDGKLNDPLWGVKPTDVLPSTRTHFFLRHDAEQLYVAMTRPSVTNRLGKTAGWSRTTKGEDAPVWNDDSCELFISDEASGKVVHLGVSASGARFDALAAGPAANEDPAWSGTWSSAALGDDSSLNFEIAIPFGTLAAAGLKKERLAINLQMNQKDVSGEVFMYPAGMGRDLRSKETAGEALSFLGAEGRAHCRNFFPLGLGEAPAVPERTFALRLHFAELDDAAPGQRVFDVKAQGKTVIENLDIAKEAGPRSALVKEIAGIKAREALTIEFVSKAAGQTVQTAPLLSALELREEGFTPPTPPSPSPVAHAAKK